MSYFSEDEEDMALQAVSTGAATGAYEYYVNKVEKETAIKLGAVMAGADFAANKATNYLHVNRHGAKLLLAAGMYTVVAPRVVDTGFNDGGMMVRGLAALGGLVAGGVVHRVATRYTGGSTTGDVGSQISSYSNTLSMV